MKLWILFGLNGVDGSPFGGYDSYDAVVVRAETEIAARHVACTLGGGQGQAWVIPEWCTCEPLEAEGNAEVILGSYNAG